MKVLFLDIDGVVNSSETLKRSTRGTIGIDPYLAFIVGKIVLDTDAKVVLSSSWRFSHDLREEVRSMVVDFIDTTPTPGVGTRGGDIDMWLSAHPEVVTYAILDDDLDMLPEQIPNFFQTSFSTGITEEIAKKVTEHLNKGV